MVCRFLVLLHVQVRGARVHRRLHVVAHAFLFRRRHPGWRTQTRIHFAKYDMVMELSGHASNFQRKVQLFHLQRFS